MARELRFGVFDGRMHSPYWKVRAAARRAELVVSMNRTGSFFHLTMHEDEAHWHLKVVLPSGETTRPWTPPSDRIPGVRRLIRLLLPPESLRYAAPPRSDRVTWHPAPIGDDVWSEFTVLHCRRGLPEIRGATPVGDVTLADGSRALVISRQGPGAQGRLSFAAEDADAVTVKLRGEAMGLLVHGLDDDGCLWILQLFNRARNEAPD